MISCSFQTPIGMLEVTGDEEFIYGISFDKVNKIFTPTKLILSCIEQIDLYFSGKLKIFDVPHVIKRTTFQKMVLDYVTQIGYGETRTYKQIANDLGNEHAVRAIGYANSHNPLPIIIPCHRVIGTNGSLTGYAGGLWRKKWLLNHEKSDYQLNLFGL